MINLLPDAKKRNIKAARANTILLRYIFVLIGAVIFIGGVIYVSYQSLKLSEDSAVTKLGLGADTSSGAQSSDLAAAIEQSPQQTPTTSALITTIGRSLPPDTVLRSLSIKPENRTGEPLKFTLYAKQPMSSADLQPYIGSSGLLTDVKISTASPSKAVQGYAYAIEVTATLSSGTQPDSPSGGPMRRSRLDTLRGGR